MLTVTKTDEIECLPDAMYGEKMQPAPYKLRSDSILVLRQKCTVPRQLKRQLVATRTLRGSMEVLPFFDPKCKKVIEKTIVFLEKQIKGMEEGLAYSIKSIGITLVAALIVWPPADLPALITPDDLPVIRGCRPPANNPERLSMSRETSTETGIQASGASPILMDSIPRILKQLLQRERYAARVCAVRLDELSMHDNLHNYANYR